jgi:branched-chain amino acid transport system substrate-binding protein
MLFLARPETSPGAERAPERPSRLRRLAKAGVLGACAVLIAACATNPMNDRPESVNRPDRVEPQPGQTGRPQGPRPDVRPAGEGGPPATGGPRSGSGGSGTETIVVGLLVPESGRPRDQLALGTALRDAVQMALFDAGRSDISFIIKDTGAGPGRAAAAAQAAIKEGADILLGPVFAEDVTAVGNVARNAGIPVIAFSSDNTVASPGVFLLSFPLEEEVRQIVNYGASRGIAYYGALVPQNQYGRRAAMAYRDAVSAIGGELSASTTYGGEGGIYPSIMQLDGKQFEALFVPDGGGQMRNVANLLKFGPPQPPPPKPLTAEEIAAGKEPPPPPAPVPRAALPEFLLMGTGLWDEGSTGASGGVAGGVFAAPEPSGRQNFTARFNSMFGYRPARIATLGYDAFKLVAVLSSGGAPGAFSYGNIADPNGFAGIDGIFRFRPGGTIQRGLAIMQVTGSGFQIVRGAPRTFQSLGF